MKTVEKSQALLKKASACIPSATQTFSKGPTQWPRGISPHFIQRGKGAFVWDVDGNKYLDHLMALGAVILGYANDEVNAAIKKQLDDGIVFSQMHPLEIDVAEKLIHYVPSAEMVKFFKNGSDATTAAIRAARGYTGRDHIAYCGYHGWHDWHIAHTTRSSGIPDFNKQLSFQFTYNDIASLETIIQENQGKIAAVIMEPVGIELPCAGFLEAVRDICTKNQIVLIFDEIVTGFRLSLGGFQSICGVIPDLSCFGKAIANGMPLSALVGHKDIMRFFDTHLFVSGTFGGETASLAAASKTIDILQRDSGLEKIKKYSTDLCFGLDQLIKQYRMNDYLSVKGFPQRSILSFKDKDNLTLEMQKTYFMQECIKQDLLYFCSHVPCVAHGDEELGLTLNILDSVIEKFAGVINSENLIENLEAQVIEPIFRKP